MITVNDMYKYSTGNDKLLLSNYSSTFWNEYVTNHSTYDKIFRRMFYSFCYFMQTDVTDVDSVTNQFIDDVKSHLMLNDKKYSELYRLHILNDADYDFTKNYNLIETYAGSDSKSSDDTYGQRSDSSTDTKGSQTNSVTNKVSPYDNENFYNETSQSDTLGNRTDESVYIKGNQNDTHTENGTESHSITRSGNTGGMSNTELIKQHKNFWNTYKFYEMIFRDIASELLIINDCV